MKQKLGFIGMGHMGSHMATRLLGAGYEVTVYDRSKEKSQAIAGAQIAVTPRELAAQSEVVMISVTDDEAVDALVSGSDGVLAGLRKGALIIDLSTVSPDASRRLYHAAKEKGAAMIDAAVSGSVPQVDEGTLVIFAGGDRDTFDQCRPILDILGQHVFYMGVSGMGTTMKLVVNTLLGLGLQSLAEAIAMGEKAGLDRGSLLDALGQTAVLSPSQKSKLENAKTDEYPTFFRLSLMRKDLGLVMKEARNLDLPLPATAAAERVYASALAQRSDEDFSVVIRFMRDVAGLPG